MARPDGIATYSEAVRVREALRFLSADCDRDAWVRIGAAIKNGLGDEGFDAWDEWSREAIDRYNPRDARAVWTSLKPQGGITLATLFGEAKKAGYIPRFNGHTVAPTPAAQAKREDAQHTADAEEAAKHERAAAIASAVWKARHTRAHRYLHNKGVIATDTTGTLPAAELARIVGYEPAAGGEKLEGLILCLPIVAGGRISSMEFIDERGRKSALYGGRKRGGYWSAGKLPEGDGAGITIHIAEGAATALSVFQASGSPAVASFSAGNLKPAALALRSHYPKAQLVIVADLGKGEDKAHEAAAAVDGLVYTPDFGPDRSAGAKDANDLHNHHGLDALKRDLANATAPKVGQAQLPPASAPAADVERTGPTQAPAPLPEPQLARANRSAPVLSAADAEAVDGVQIIRGDQISPEAVDWLWGGYLASGKVHIMAGAPGTGKTTLALGLMAALTRGGRWPDGGRATAGGALMWSGEDSIADTLIPRLIAAGADLARVHFVGDRKTLDGVRAFDPAEDFAALEAAAARIPGLRLVVVDPIVSAIAGDSHKSADVRRGLQPLVRFAERTGCAVLGISHFSKGTAGRDPVERVTGSVAFGALARLVLATANVPDEDGGGRIMVRAKSNIGPDGGGFRYELRLVRLDAPYSGIEATRPEWLGPLEGEARELLAAVETQADPEERSATKEATEQLREILAGGSMVETRVARQKLKSAGFTDKQIRRARESLKVNRTRDGFGGKDYWSLPPADSRSCPIPAVCAHSKKVGTNGQEREAEGMNERPTDGDEGAPLALIEGIA